MISKQEVKHIAKLARLGLTEKELEKYQKELSSILDYVEKLKKADISKTEPTSHSIIELPKEAQMKKRTESSSPKVENVGREDVESKRQETRNKKLMELAPETKNGYLKVKSIF